MSVKIFRELGEETRNLIRGEESTERVAELLMQAAEMEGLKNIKNLRTRSGVALSPMNAAGCLDDIERTRKFIRGLGDAISRVREKKDGPVKILEVGSGPTPISLAAAASLENGTYKLGFIDIFEETIASLRRTLEKLGITEACYKLEQKDASYGMLKDDPDIVVVEVMDTGLLNEPQAAIIFNLARQLQGNPIFIPENISVSASTVNGNIQLGELVSIGKRFRDDAKVASWVSRKDMLRVSKRFELPNDFDAKNGTLPLELQTQIHVFGDKLIHADTSRVTRKTTINADVIAKNKIILSYELGSKA